MIKSFFLVAALSFLFGFSASSKTVSCHQKKFNSINLADTFPTKDSMDESIFEKVEIEASFPGGDEAWIKFLQSHLDPTVPTRMRAPKGKYTVWIQFIVDKDGKILEFKPLTTNGYGMEKEVIRILKKSPKWKPAIQDGRTVRAYRKQPVTFVVEDF
jgi:protein TonB